MPPSTHSALLLRRTPFGESSLVVRVLTPELGRVDLVAKGAYRPQSRLFATLDWFHTLELVFQPKSRGLVPLQAADWSDRREIARQGADAYRAAMTVLELCEAAARMGHPETKLFALAQRALDGLSAGKLAPGLEQVRFEMGFLKNLGVEPALARCAACGKGAPALPQSDRVPFSAGSGGRLCTPCAASARESGMRVGTMPISVLQGALEIPAKPREVLALSPPSAELVDRIRDLTGRYLDYHLESRLRSQRAFLQESNRNAPLRGGAPTMPTGH